MDKIEETKAFIYRWEKKKNCKHEWKNLKKKIEESQISKKNKKKLVEKVRQNK